LGWCPACEGLGVQTGANPAALLRSSKATLAEGAVAIWPSVNGKIFPFMLDALARATGIPTSVPFDQLGAKHRRLLMHGTGDRWFDVHVSPAGASEPFAEAVSHQGEKARPVFRYQYKGLYPALDEASHVSPAFRSRLEHLVDEVECSLCNGSRLRDDAAAVQLRGRTIDELCRMPLGRLLAWVNDWTPDAAERQVAGELIREIRNRVQFLVDVGLDYLTLSRPAPSLSGGEMQRIRLAAQVGSGLCGVLYVLDEPTIGLHARDNKRLLAALKRLRDLGNTLLVVEHDREVVKGADRLLDFGPAAGRLGGEIVAQGTPAEVARRRNSVTGPYLSGKKAIPVPSNRRMESARGKGGQALPPRPPGGSWLEVCGARHNNLQNITARIPLGTFTVVTGPSGSGKSSLVNDVLYGALARLLHRAKVAPAAHDEILGIEQINKVIRVDQQPLGQTPTSNPATFTGVFEHIRTLFAQLPEAKLRGYSPRRFSFNVAGGRCEKCEGNGQLKIEMHFLPDVWVECDDCRGRRYEPETLTVRYHGQSIADVLDMSCGQALQLFKNIPRIRRILQTLCDVGLDYITLGQSAPTLSGGEAQRVKLAAELSRPDTGRTLYLLDEPTTGLHFEDLAKLLDVLNRLVDLGNTVVVIEHNLDVVKTADWVLDMGPEAGDEGGRIVVAGTPEDVVAHARTANRPGGNGVTAIARSYTGEVLEPVLKAGPHLKRAIHDFAAEEEKQEGDLEIKQIGGDARMPWEINGPRWHTRDRVGRNGNPCRWDGRILADIVQRIQDTDCFSETDWNNRSIVEICGLKKSDGWFFHAITGEEWLLKLKFRTTKNSFRRDEIVQRLDLKPLNEVPDLPLYGTEPRTKCRNLRGPWQEVELRVHSFGEIDRPEFWKFLDEAIAGFRRFAEHVAASPEDIMPWKVLGRRWHFTRRGFTAGRKVRWSGAVLEQLVEILTETAPKAQALWNNKVLVPFYVKPQKVPWATLLTKKTDAVHLVLSGPKGRFALGQVRSFGTAPELDAEKPDHDQIRLKFHNTQQLEDAALTDFLKQHYESVSSNGGE
jgi:excinuclease ABC subunit A